MELVILGLVVYKIVQMLDLLSPKEAMPWVKVLISVFLSYVVVLCVWTDNVYLDGLAVATIAGIVHSTIRLLTYCGDMARTKSLR